MFSLARGERWAWSAGAAAYGALRAREPWRGASVGRGAPGPLGEHAEKRRVSEHGRRQSS